MKLEGKKWKMESRSLKLLFVVGILMLFIASVPAADFIIRNETSKDPYFVVNGSTGRINVGDVSSSSGAFNIQPGNINAIYIDGPQPIRWSGGAYIGQYSGMMSMYSGSLDMTFRGYNGTAVKDILYMDSSTEFVGIGKTNPLHKLDVAGNVNADYFIGDGSMLTNLNIDAAGVNYWNKTGNNVQYTLGDVIVGLNRRLYFNENVASGAYLTQTSGNNLSLFNADNEEKLRFSTGTGQSPIIMNPNGGNVGIGTLNPQANMHIFSSINPVSFKIETDGGDDDSEIIIDRAINTRRSNLKFTTNDALDWNLGTMYNSGSANDVFSIGTGNNLDNSVMVFTKAGAVGIGDSTPDAGLMLDVEGNIGAQALCDENGQNCVDISTISANVLANPVVGFFSHLAIFSMDYSGVGTYPSTLTSSHDFCSGGYYVGVIKQDGTREIIQTPFGASCSDTTLSSDVAEGIKYLTWNHATDKFSWRYDTSTITSDEQVVGFYYYTVNKFQWLVDINSFRFTQTNILNMGGNNIALNGGYLSGDGGSEGVFVDSYGRVGIGTDSPSAGLDVRNGDVYIFGASNRRFLVGDSPTTGQWGGFRWDTATDTVGFGHSSSSSTLQDVVINSEGEVGIGTSSPNSTLDVNGTAKVEELNVKNARVFVDLEGDMVFRV